MSNLETPTLDECASAPAPATTLEALPGRRADLGALAIRRLLPARGRRLVGPWCFLDVFGPFGFTSGKPMDVPPHPHIGLQTVSWLLEGEALHHDSLGHTAVARPGALNLMNAGRGIAHSEETPERNTGRLHGVQLWVALPEQQRETAPDFEHHETLPALELDGGRATVILGALGGVASPGRTFSPIVGAELFAASGARLTVPLDEAFEHALLVLDGALEADGQVLAADTLYYLGAGRGELGLGVGRAGSRALLLGGAPFGERILMWWNFVARTPDEIAAAREDWQAGRRFGAVEAYRGERLEAPPFGGRPPPGA